MINKAQALALGAGTKQHEIHIGMCVRRVGKRGGVTLLITRCRVNGKCQTWKTRPDDFRLPIKSGLRDCGAITQQNAYMFHVADDCPLTTYRPEDNTPTVIA